MKRSPELAQLSRNHHVALVVARQLTRADAEHAQAAAARFVEFLAGHELAHFALEETVLLPAVPDEPHGRALAQRMLEDHEYLRFAAKRLRDPPAPVSADYLHQLGHRLRAHVQMEERELFPHLEQTLDPDTLKVLGEQLAADHYDQPGQ
jgi:hemerythrin-like domain-containing protein